MKKLKILFPTILVSSIVFPTLLVSCSKEPTPPPEVHRVIINDASDKDDFSKLDTPEIILNKDLIIKFELNNPKLKELDLDASKLTIGSDTHSLKEIGIQENQIFIPAQGVTDYHIELLMKTKDLVVDLSYDGPTDINAEYNSVFVNNFNISNAQFKDLENLTVSFSSAPVKDTSVELNPSSPESTSFGCKIVTSELAPYTFKNSLVFKWKYNGKQYSKTINDFTFKFNSNLVKLNVKYDKNIWEEIDFPEYILPTEGFSCNFLFKEEEYEKYKQDFREGTKTIKIQVYSGSEEITNFGTEFDFDEGLLYFTLYSSGSVTNNVTIIVNIQGEYNVELATDHNITISSYAPTGKFNEDYEIEHNLDYSFSKNEIKVYGKNHKTVWEEDVVSLDPLDFDITEITNSSLKINIKSITSKEILICVAKTQNQEELYADWSTGFYANSLCVFYNNSNDYNFEYSYDQFSWNNYSPHTPIVIAPKSNFYLRGKGNDLLMNYNKEKILWLGSFNLNGNCSYLLDGSEPPTDLPNYCFQYLFSNTGVERVSKDFLKDLNPGNSSYSFMFSGCTSLVSLPDLPSTTLAPHCYDSMFKNCSAITSLPLNYLPADGENSLKEYCYFSMFQNCSSLTNVPHLLALNLQPYCYSYMFSGCTSLIDLSNFGFTDATSLASNCFHYMFNNCSSLSDINLNMLPMKTLAENCYDHMFSNCSSLTTVPKLPATTLTNSCYHSMFISCSSLKISESDLLNDSTLIFKCPDFSCQQPVTGMFENINPESSFDGTPAAGKSYYWY